MQPDEYKPLPPEAHAFLDGTLKAEQEADFRRKLDRDESLRTEVEKLGAALDLLKTLPVKDPGVEFNKKVLARVRDNELAERARRRIRGARSPVWQHVAQVAAGAVAAAIVLALIGTGNAPTTPLNPADQPLFDVAAVEPNEDDLLPNLGEQYAHYRRVASNVGSLADADGDSQRILLRGELDRAGLLRRNAWLAGQIASLPLERRREYQRFLDGLDNALEILERELSESAAENRVVNLGLVQGAMDGVYTPETLARQVHFEMRRYGGRSRDAVPVSPGLELSPELASYAAVRAAVYDNDLERIVAACDAYLSPYRKAGKFARPITITLAASLLRLNRPGEAAERYEQMFGVYEEKLTPADTRLMERLMTPMELARLQQARKSLHE